MTIYSKLILCFVSLLVFCLANFSTSFAQYAVWCTNCSQYEQQLMDYAKDVETATNTAKQVEEEIKQYTNMVTQGLTLPDSIFGSIVSDLRKVKSIYDKAKSLGRDISNLSSKFSTSFPGWEAYLSNVRTSKGFIDDQFKKWSDEGLDNAKTALESAGVNVSTLEDEDATLTQLIERSKSAEGRMQAIQVGNEIAAQNVQQLQKLRDLVATQIDLQANYMAQQAERQAVSDAFAKQFFSGEVSSTGKSQKY